jgi:hypothetical protein
MVERVASALARMATRKNGTRAHLIATTGEDIVEMFWFIEPGDLAVPTASHRQAAIHIQSTLAGHLLNQRVP